METYKELQAVNASFEVYKKPVHGEEVIWFTIHFETATTSNDYCFQAPRCSTNEELKRYAYYQVESRTLKMILDGWECYAGWEEKISFRVHHVPSTPL
jgi:hypothetical protein